jgi:hypothetical protein
MGAAFYALWKILVPPGDPRWNPYFIGPGRIFVDNPAKMMYNELEIMIYNKRV